MGEVHSSGPASSLKWAQVSGQSSASSSSISIMCLKMLHTARVAIKQCGVFCAHFL